jgi:uncharacterized protein YqeY
MGLKETVLGDLKTAMKDKDEARLAAIRFLQAAIKNKEIEVRPNTVSEQDIIAVVRKIGNQLKDAITQFEQAGRTDLADKEKAQLKVIEAYLPQQMSREALEKVIAEVMKETGAASIKDMGTVIKATQAKTAGAADGKMISEIVKAKLS